MGACVLCGFVSLTMVSPRQPTDSQGPGQGQRRQGYCTYGQGSCRARLLSSSSGFSCGCGCVDSVIFCNPPSPPESIFLIHQQREYTIHRRTRLATLVRLFRVMDWRYGTRSCTRECSIVAVDVLQEREPFGWRVVFPYAYSTAMVERHCRGKKYCLAFCSPPGRVRTPSR